MSNIPDDIPEAKRDPWDQPSASTASRQLPLLWIGLSGGAIALGVGTALFLQGQSLSLSNFGWASGASPSTTLSPHLRSSFENLGMAFPGGVPAQSSDVDSATAGEAGLLGHRAYDEAPANSLVPVVADGSIRLRAAAASRFQEMAAAARADRISIVPLSGYRSVQEQQYLFFGIKAERGLRAEERAAVSAPPGYSEHHTGYAVDIGDGTQPDAHLEESFEQTAAFRWLSENAAYYGFELSFEGGASDRVSYEPWHWRFVGDRPSLETFYGSGAAASDATTDAATDAATTERSSDRP
ncbi:MAG: M15 family metallopeptidase [Elainellaceae cyanobacterium]